MSWTGAFIHLCHVWGLLGLITAMRYGVTAYNRWEHQGGTFSNAPGDTLRLLYTHFKLVWRDLGSIPRAAIARFTGIDYRWPLDPESQWRYSNEQALLVGIFLGGATRFFTAFYWAGKNTTWITPETVIIPALPLVFAIIADLSHQSTAWPTKLYRIRLAALASILWVLIGAVSYA